MFGIPSNLKKLNPLSGRDLAMDFCGNSLKLVLVKSISNKREVTNIIARDIAGLSDEDITKIIRSAFITLNAKNPYVMATISSHLALTKNIEVPSTNVREIKEIVNLQAGRHTPYSREEIIVDYLDIGTYKKNYTKILLVIVGRNIIKRQFAILDQAGIKAERFVFAPEGLAASAAGIFKLEGQNGPCAMVHVDEIFSDFMVIFNDKLIFTRSIPIGSKHLDEAGPNNPAMQKFVTEVKDSWEAYQGEDIASIPQTVILTGAVEERGGLEVLLTNSLRLPVKIRLYVTNLFLTEEATKSLSMPAFKGTSFFNVIAPLITPLEMNINLVPEELKLRKTVEERGKELIKVGTLGLSAFVLISTILVSKIYFKNIFLSDLKTQYEPADQEARKLEKDFSKIILVNGYLSSRGYSLEVLSELYHLTPDDIAYSDIKYDSQGKMSLAGSAASMSIIFSFVDNLGRSKYFKEAKTKYTTKRKDGDRDVVDFEITTNLKKEGQSDAGV